MYDSGTLNVIEDNSLMSFSVGYKREDDQPGFSGVIPFNYNLSTVFKERNIIEIHTANETWFDLFNNLLAISRNSTSKEEEAFEEYLSIFEVK